MLTIISLFADDTVIYVSDNDNNNNTIALISIQDNIDTFVSWCIKNRYPVNISRQDLWVLGIRNVLKMQNYI